MNVSTIKDYNTKLPLATVTFFLQNTDLNSRTSTTRLTSLIKTLNTIVTTYTTITITALDKPVYSFKKVRRKI